MTTIDGNGGSDVAMDDGSGDKKEPVAVVPPPQPEVAVQIKQEKAGSGSDATTTIGQDPLHAFALTLGSDSKPPKRPDVDERNTNNAWRKKTGAYNRKNKNANAKSQFNNSSSENKCFNNACLLSRKAAQSQFDSILDGFDLGVPAGGKRRKEETGQRSRSTLQCNLTPAAAPVEGNTLHAMPHPQLDDDFEQNLRGIDELGDADDFDFDVLLGEEHFLNE